MSGTIESYERTPRRAFTIDASSTTLLTVIIYRGTFRKSLCHVRKIRLQVAPLRLAVAAPLGLDDPAVVMHHQPVIEADEAGQQVADHLRLAGRRGERPTRLDRQLIQI